jgi:hypothetical protein
VAIRYCGDVEVRMRHLGGNRYRVRVCTPSAAHSRELTFPFRGSDPESYDQIALALIKACLRSNPKTPVERDERGQIVIRRVFQAPCPIRGMQP